MPRLILASASPRRLELLHQIGLEPDRVEPAAVDETVRTHELPRKHAARLAETKARELHLAGATVLRGPMGFGHSSRLHTSKILRLSEDLPLVIEIVDSKEKIDAFLPVLDAMMGSGLVTLEKVQVLRYGERRRH